MKKIAVILAGGASQRMIVGDKAIMCLNGVRLVDHVVERLKPQVDDVLIAGPNNYGTGLRAIPDDPHMIAGPAGGVFSINRWLKENTPIIEGFFTVPVDAPFLPPNLVERLGDLGNSAIASVDGQDQPTFAYWEMDGLTKAFEDMKQRSSVSLKAIANACGAYRIRWDEIDAFANINTLQDLAAAEKRVAQA